MQKQHTIIPQESQVLAELQKKIQNTENLYNKAMTEARERQCPNLRSYSDRYAEWKKSSLTQMDVVQQHMELCEILDELNEALDTVDNSVSNVCVVYKGLLDKAKEEIVPTINYEQRYATALEHSDSEKLINKINQDLRQAIVSGHEKNLESLAHQIKQLQITSTDHINKYQSYINSKQYKLSEIEQKIIQTPAQISEIIMSLKYNPSDTIIKQKEDLAEQLLALTESIKQARSILHVHDYVMELKAQPVDKFVEALAFKSTQLSTKFFEVIFQYLDQHKKIIPGIRASLFLLNQEQLVKIKEFIAEKLSNEKTIYERLQFIDLMNECKINYRSLISNLNQDIPDSIIKGCLLLNKVGCKYLITKELLDLKHNWLLPAAMVLQEQSDQKITSELIDSLNQNQNKCYAICNSAAFFPANRTGNLSRWIEILLSMDDKQIQAMRNTMPFLIKTPECSWFLICITQHPTLVDLFCKTAPENLQPILDVLQYVFIAEDPENADQIARACGNFLEKRTIEANKIAQQEIQEFLKQKNTNIQLLHLATTQNLAWFEQNLLLLRTLHQFTKAPMEEMGDEDIDAATYATKKFFRKSIPIIISDRALPIKYNQLNFLAHKTLHNPDLSWRLLIDIAMVILLACSVLALITALTVNWAALATISPAGIVVGLGVLAFRKYNKWPLFFSSTPTEQEITLRRTLNSMSTEINKPRSTKTIKNLIEGAGTYVHNMINNNQAK